MSKRPKGKFIFLWISIGFFLLAVAYKQLFITAENTPQQNALVVSEKIEREIKSIEGTIADLKSTITTSKNLSFNSYFREASYPYYVFSNRRVIFWSNNLFTPIHRDVQGEFKLAYVETTKGKSLARKEQFTHDNKSYEIVFLIPLEEKTSVVNEYLKNTYNENLFTDSNIEIVHEATDEDHQIISINEQELFSVKFGNTYSNTDQVSRGVIISLLIISFVCTGLFIKNQLTQYVKERSIGLGFLFLLSCFLILRSLMLLTGFPFDFVYIALFDPKHYASSMVNPSLGDLLLNLVSLLFLGFYVFNHFLKSSGVRNVLMGKSITQFLVAVLCMFFSFFWLMVQHQTMKTLNFDSQWSMDITQNLDFNYFKLIAFFMYFISVVVYFLFAHVCFRLYIQLVQHNTKRYLASLVAGIVLFIVFAMIQNLDMEGVILINLLFFLVIKFFKLPKFIGRIQYLTFIYLFSFGLPAAIIGLYANIQYNRSNTDFNKSRLANQLLVESNYFTELQLDDVSNQIKDDIFIQKRIFSPYASKLIIEKKIRREYLNNLEKFDIQIYVFNSRGEPFDQFNFKYNYHQFKSTLGEYKIDMEGLYFINQSRGSATIRYMNFIEIQDRGQVIGFVLLDLTQKRLVPNSVLPQLLNESRYAQQIDGSDQFSYGVFNGSELLYNYGEFNYRKNFPSFVTHSDKLLDQNVLIRGFNHKAYKGDGNKIVIISAKEATIEARFANFSFLFLVYVFSILLILITVTFYQGLRKIQLNYATKIQLYLNFAFFAPLIIVSVTTMSIIVQTFKSSLEHQYREYADNLSAEISGPLSQYRGLDIEGEEFSDIVFQIAENADLDINVYLYNGRLVSSSLFQIYQNEILSFNIDPRAYIKIVEESESVFVQEEQVGLLNYKNVYMGIRSSETGDIIGILSLPFFASQQDLEGSTVEILSNIINIFTFVFIIFLFISFFVSRGLTFPLQLITQKIKRTTLSAYNEPLSWNSEDEIGLLVTEYNRMLLNLDTSKKALAKSEKESAWREMAKQVAHEIKNPLTPMKLTLQHMKRVIDDESEGVPNDKKLKQINALLEQIETLNGIATSFSDFAKMPEPKTEKLDVSTVLKETIDLYNKKELGQIFTQIEQGEFMIEGDRKWLGRAFSNLIINGFQAVNDKKSAKIEVNLFTLEGDMVRIEISDNGNGIPEHIQDKVFTPNFSTKYTGSGLGLAITKKGIEHSNGKIWFSTKEGLGTTFFMEIPLCS